MKPTRPECTLRRRGSTLLGLATLSLLASTALADTLELDQRVFRPGEEFEVYYSAPEAQSNAWAGIVPSDVDHGSEATNDQHDLTYQYLRGETSGTLTFAAPSEPGRYDVRLHDTDSDGRETASVSFVVWPTTARLTLAKRRFTTGETIELDFQVPADLPSNAWVGIVPADVPHGSEATNDQHDLTYRYLERVTEGRFEFTAPSAPGSYDFRLHDTDSSGVEIGSVSFEVVEK